jgi:transcriptional regulator with XRE-family HTH domain
VALSKKEWARIKVFGASVRRERVRKGLTQDELAERADIATRTSKKSKPEKSIFFSPRRSGFNRGFVALGNG